MTIGELSKLTGVSAKAIRYYEETGLLSKPKRQPNGYRSYQEKDVQILKFIHRARDLGFPIDEVSSLLALWSNKRRSSRNVQQLAKKHVTGVEARISQLEEIRATLTHLIGRCQGDDRPDCPILNDLTCDHHRIAEEKP